MLCDDQFLRSDIELLAKYRLEMNKKCLDREVSSEREE
jgi:hypothetical protein